MAIICKYKFNSTLCANYLPEFNSEFTGYTKTDIDNGDNTITRTIEHSIHISYITSITIIYL